MLWCALLLTLVSCDARETDLVLGGRIERHDARVGSKLGGRVEAVLVAEGATVTSGTLLLRLGSAELRAALDRAAADQAAAHARLALLEAGSRVEDIRRSEALVAARRADLALRLEGFRPEEVAQTRAELLAAESARDLARTELARADELLKSGAQGREQFEVRRAALESAEARVTVAEERLKMMTSGSRPGEIDRARAELAAAEADLERLRKGPRREELDAARADVQRASAAVRLARADLAEAEIRAPFDAVVDTLDHRPGDLIRAGEPVAVLFERGTPWVRCYIPENRLGSVPVGTKVSVRVDSLPNEFPGVVRHISHENEFTPRNVQSSEKRAELVFEARVEITTGGAEALSPGMFADVHVPSPR